MLRAAYSAKAPYATSARGLPTTSWRIQKYPTNIYTSPDEGNVQRKCADRVSKSHICEERSPETYLGFGRFWWVPLQVNLMFAWSLIRHLTRNDNTATLWPREWQQMCLRAHGHCGLHHRERFLLAIRVQEQWHPIGVLYQLIHDGAVPQTPNILLETLHPCRLYLHDPVHMHAVRGLLQRNALHTLADFDTVECRLEFLSSRNRCEVDKSVADVNPVLEIDRKIKEVELPSEFLVQERDKHVTLILIRDITQHHCGVLHHPRRIVMRLAAASSMSIMLVTTLAPSLVPFGAAAAIINLLRLGSSALPENHVLVDGEVLWIHGLLRKRRLIAGLVAGQSAITSLLARQRAGVTYHRKILRIHGLLVICLVAEHRTEACLLARQRAHSARVAHHRELLWVHGLLVRKRHVHGKRCLDGGRRFPLRLAHATGRSLCQCAE
mmetsp:Transcript_14076/g.38323  ORF Transcript_14076/g.38323 Transcript_14076/m.38323 type:complete len:438 (+) Transcript_14076:102-1415(+)